MSDVAQTIPPAMAPAEENFRDRFARAYSARAHDPIEAARLAEEAVRNLKAVLGDPSRYRRQAIVEWVIGVVFLACGVWFVGTEQPVACLVVAFAATQAWRGVRDWRWANAIRRWLG